MRDGRVGSIRRDAYVRFSVISRRDEGDSKRVVDDEGERRVATSEGVNGSRNLKHDGLVGVHHPQSGGDSISKLDEHVAQSRVARGTRRLFERDLGDLDRSHLRSKDLSLEIDRVANLERESASSRWHGAARDHLVSFVKRCRWHARMNAVVVFASLDIVAAWHRCE